MTNIDRLLELMSALRHPDTGCPWDLAQNFASIAPYTLEEAYEVADAIDRNNMTDLREELGDLLLQVVFHAQMAKEAELFDFDQVAGAIADKLVRRHPHVFAGESAGSPEELQRAWESHKRQERIAAGKPTRGVLDGITPNLPALVATNKIGKRAARVGFDWDTADQVVDKIHEELDELAQARAASDTDNIEEEIGDLLLAVANLSRHLQVDPEKALRRANRKFCQRLRAVEADIHNEGGDWADCTLEQLEAIWQAVKKRAGQPDKL